MKDKNLIINTVIATLFVINITIIIIFKNIIDDKTLVINGYKSDKDVCQREYEELYENYKQMEEQLNEAN